MRGRDAEDDGAGIRKKVEDEIVHGKLEGTGVEDKNEREEPK